MTAPLAADLVAATAAALVDQRDVAQSLDRLLLGSLDALGVDAAGLLVRERIDSPFELLACTTHRVEELELFQRQVEDGPCVEAIRTDAVVVAETVDDLAPRWSTVGSAIVAAGYGSAYAFPMHWRGQAIGALNTYRQDDRDRDADGTGRERRSRGVDRALGQTLADLATLIVFAPTADAGAAGEQVRRALQGRVVLEQAIGVIAQHDGVAMDQAYLRLREGARRSKQTITEAARRILAGAADRSS